MTVYLIHFDAPIAPGRHTCQHYLGYAADLESRLAEHRRGTGARLLAVANERGITWQLVRTWEGDRTLERQIKNWKMGPRLCPICRAQRAAERAIIQDQSNRNGVWSRGL